MSKWTKFRDKAEGVVMQPIQAAGRLAVHPKEIAPSYVLKHDSPTALDQLMLGPLSKRRAIRNTGRVAGLAAAAVGLGIAGGAALGGEAGATEVGAGAGATEVGAGAGATEVGAGLPLAEEAGAGLGVDAATGLSGLPAETSIGDLPPLSEPGMGEGMAPSELTGYDPTLIGEPPMEAGTAPGTAAPASMTDKIFKYGPLALGVGSIAAQNIASRKAAKKIGDIGGPQRAEGQNLLNQYNAGQINPADQFAIDQWAQGASAQAKDYYAKAGLSDSSMAKNAQNEIQTKAVAMKQQALNNLLIQGTNLLNITDQYQLAAINAELRANQAASQQAFQFFAAYGNWLRVSPQMTS